jgi:hypothetical protein
VRGLTLGVTLTPSGVLISNAPIRALGSRGLLKNVREVLALLHVASLVTNVLTSSRE